MNVHLVVFDTPYIYTEIEKVFLDEENAYIYIEETYPHFNYFHTEDCFIFEGADPENLEFEERYYILTKKIEDN